jgi:chromosome segregation ATPase
MSGLVQKLLVFGLLIGVTASLQAATKVVYRYKNNEGITVMDNKIPAEYASKGYEIMSTTGKLIKVVPPSLTKEEAEKQKAEKLAREERIKADIDLRRSYSEVADIDAAKERNLASLSANIGILKSNLESTRQDLANETARAASFERSGRKVTNEILKKIDGLQNKEKDLAQQIKQREKEYQEVSDKFDADKKRFIEITSGDLPSA